MFRGERINSIADRAVLHIALRADDNSPLLVDGKDVRPGIAKTLRRMARFAELEEYVSGRRGVRLDVQTPELLGRTD